jgi:cytochrome o ubiquinol oxidase operon protein cyoD
VAPARCGSRTGGAVLARIGVHLVLFPHLGSGRGDTNNIPALAFGVSIVLLSFSGSIWIVAHLDTNMMSIPMS